MSGYQAVLMAPDGDYVTDHRGDTVEEVEEAIADQGSRWFFYPFAGIVEGGGVSDDARMIRVFGLWDDNIHFDATGLDGITLAEWRGLVMDEAERLEYERDLPACPKCHGAGKVGPAEVEA